VPRADRVGRAEKPPRSPREAPEKGADVHKLATARSTVQDHNLDAERTDAQAKRTRSMLATKMRKRLPASGMLLFETTAFAFSGIMIGWLGGAPDEADCGTAARISPAAPSDATTRPPANAGHGVLMRSSHAPGLG